LTEEAEFPGIVEIEIFQVAHIRIDEMVEDPLPSGNDLIVADRMGIFRIDDADLGQIIMFIRQFIRIVQKEELYGGKYEKAHGGK